MKKLSLLFLSLVITSATFAQQFDNYKPDVATVQLTQSNLPIVLIESGGNVIAPNYDIHATMKIIDNGSGATNYADLSAHPGQTLTYDGKVSLSYRGSSSFISSAKKPLQIKPINASGNVVAASLGGLTTAKEFALLAPTGDRSLLRTQLAWTLARQFMSKVPQTKFCEVVINDTYYGIYCLSEVVASLMGSGDQLFEVGRADESHLYTSSRKPVSTTGTTLSYANVTYHYTQPAYSEISNISEVNSQLAALETSLSGTIGSDVNTTEFIDYVLNTELAHLADGYRLHTYIYKENGGQWKPSLWDSSLGFGNFDALEGFRTDTWVWKENDVLSAMDEPQLVPSYWKAMMENETFVAALKSRWQEYRASVYTLENINSTIDGFVATLKDGGALSRDSQAWPRWGKRQWPNYNIPSDYDAEITYLKQWISDRLSWLDSAIENLSSGSSGGGGSEPTYVQQQLTVTSGFNVDVIDANLSDIASNATGPLDGHSSHFMSEDFPGAYGTNLPSSGFLTSEGGYEYQLGDYLQNNCFYIGINARDSHTLGFPSSGTVTFQENPNATKLAILCIGTNKGYDLGFNLKVNYTDGTTDNMGSIPVSDWCENDHADRAYVTSQRYFHASQIQSINVQLSEVVVDVDKTKKIKSVTIATECQDGTWGYGCVGFFAFTVVKEEASTGITTLDNPSANVVKSIWSLNGQKRTHLEPGMNIVRYEDGSVKKIMVKR